MAAIAGVSTWQSPIAYYSPTSPHKTLPKLWTLPMITNHLKGQLESEYPISTTKHCNAHFSHVTPLYATLRRPKGFGPSPKKTKKTKKQNEDSESEDEDEAEGEEDAEEEGVIPEIVTNRMISRMGFTVGIPLFVGLLFFPFFYYLKVGLKIDVPTWVPFIVSFIFFGTALLGVSYGIVSSSWDPLRKGSLLGWNEAKKNWPVFWQSLRGGSTRK
ncbi:hypothetical protein FNV43_RR08597 [Rhamnella rubrinervis]|uniref:Protein PAM68, chloroplastic n=1 Tax=Rhamnella rubrinervis TaxID=2594499 RepID=A0A8K0MJH5_9ROSA|nr:hypothetical protein FNV43_RR08597 [Rhamnella rubrinervis]